MNRLIIIGNGFDLAHGLKTSYEDFVMNIFKSNLIEFIENDYRDNNYLLFTIKKINYVNRARVLEELEEIKTLDSFLNYSEIKLIKFNTPKRYLTSGSKDIRAFEIEIHSRFFSELIIDKNWTDVENIYYRLLVQEFKTPTHGHSKLNEEFQVINNLLVEYIKNINNEIPHGETVTKLNPLLDKLLLSDPGDQMKSICFLNFNYTKLLYRYTEYRNQTNLNLLSIHGNAHDEESIIFGYGDDTEEHYKSLENTLDDEYLKNIKSFKYKLSDNYDKIMGFLEMGFFEVYIVGHSLGVSDRVLLKTIFEDSNCSKIRIFHRGNKDSYFKKCISISRHFDNKIAMRKKIIPFDLNDTIE